MAKIDVITVKLVCHIPIGTSNRKSLNEAYDEAEGLIVDAGNLGFFTTEPELRHNRVAAPPPKPEPEDAEPPDDYDDGLDIPENLRRAPKSAAAE